MLGGEARCRLLGTAPRTVEVEVLAAPGLEPGTHLRLSAATARSARRLRRQPGSLWIRRAPAGEHIVARAGVRAAAENHDRDG